MAYEVEMKFKGRVISTWSIMSNNIISKLSRIFLKLPSGTAKELQNSERIITLKTNKKYKILVAENIVVKLEKNIFQIKTDPKGIFLNTVLRSSPFEEKKKIYFLSQG